LLSSDPGGVQQELVAQDLPGDKSRKICFPTKEFFNSSEFFYHKLYNRSTINILQNALFSPFLVFTGQTCAKPIKKVYLLTVKTTKKMENYKSLFWNKAMTWGALVGGVLAIELLIAYFANTYFSPYRTYVDWAIYIAGIYLGTNSFKKLIPKKAPFTYGSALGFGTSIMLFAGIVTGVVTFMVYKFDVDFMDAFLVNVEEVLLNSGLSDSLIEQQIKLQKQMMTPTYIAFSQTFNVVFYGFLICLLSSIFLKKKNSGGFDEAMNELDETN
jgi:hypothetical protein